MKNIITIVVCIIYTLAYSQEGVIAPLNTLSYNVPNGTYIKDIDNIFQPYTGTWQGTWQGKLLILEIEKVSHKLNSSLDGSYYYEDQLIAKHKVVQTATGSTIESTMEISNLENAKIESLGYPKDNEFDFLYSDRDKCYNTGRFRLEGNPATNQLQYFYFYESFWISKDCTYLSQDEIPINIPTGTLVLTRVQ